MTQKIKIFAVLLVIISLLSCVRQEGLKFAKKVEIKHLNFGAVNPFEGGFKTKKAMLHQMDNHLGKSNLLLIDVNENNKFNESGIDAFAAFPIDTEEFFVLDSFRVIKSENNFKLNNQIISLDFRNGGFHINENPTSKEFVGTSIFNRLPNFSIETIDGVTISTDELINGEKDIYIEFWGTWCKSCIPLIPKIRNLHHNRADDIRILSLAYRDQKEELLRFRKIHKMDWEIAIIDQEFRSMFNQTSFPKGFLFEKNGELIDDDFHPDEYK